MMSNKCQETFIKSLLHARQGAEFPAAEGSSADHQEAAATEGGVHAGRPAAQVR